VRALPRTARWGLTAVLGLGALSAAGAALPYYAALEVAHFVLLGALAVGVAAAVRETPEWAGRLLLGAVVVSVLVYGARFAVGYGVSVALPALEVGRETIGGFVNTRFFNQYQTWTLPLLAAAVWAVPSRWRGLRGTVFGMLAFWWALVFASHVRGTVVAVGGAGLMVVLLFGRAAYRWLATQAAGVLAGGGLYVVLFRLGGGVVQRLSDAKQYTKRLEWWGDTLEVIGGQPWLGLGPMHFAGAPAHPVTWGHPHNALLQLLVEWGVPAALLLVGLAGWGAWCWIQQERNQVEPVSDAETALRVGLVASLGAGAAHALVSGLLVMPVSQTLAALVVGWAWGRYRPREAPEEGLSRVAAGSLGVLLVAAVGIVGSSLQHVPRAEDRRATYLDMVDHRTVYPRYWVQGYMGIDTPAGRERVRRKREGAGKGDG